MQKPRHIIRDINSGIRQCIAQEQTPWQRWIEPKFNLNTFHNGYRGLIIFLEDDILSTVLKSAQITSMSRAISESFVEIVNTDNTN